MHNQVLEKVDTMQAEIAESRKKLHREVQTRIATRQAAYNELA
jgi:hypothetical protein